MGLLGAVVCGADPRGLAAGGPLLAAAAGRGGGGPCADPEFEAVSELGAAGDRSPSPPPLPPPAVKPAVGVGVRGWVDGGGAPDPASLCRFRRALDGLPVPVVRPSSRLTGSPAQFLRSRLLPRVDAIEDDEDEAAVADGDTEEEGAFYGVDLGAVAKRLWEFHAALPRVRPHFAVKCNPDPVVIKLLATLGASFDCASEPEIRMVAAELGGDAAEVRRRVVYANPCKAASHLAFARSVGVSLMTFDNADELHKMAKVAPDARLLLRIATEDSLARCPLSSKFGASLADVPVLLRLGARLGLSIVGVAFHVGSGCTSLASFSTALDASRHVFDLATEMGLPPLTVLDIGGGFPGFDGDSSITFGEIVEVVRPRIDHLFDASVDVIAEPGRYLVTSAYSLATEVLSRQVAAPAREGARGGGDAAAGGGGSVGGNGHGPATLGGDAAVRYHLGDGVYGSFKDAVILGMAFLPRVLAAAAGVGCDGARAPAGDGLEGACAPAVDGLDGVRTPAWGGGEPPPPSPPGTGGGGASVGGRRVLPSTLCGPTNDPLDVVVRDVPLPVLSVGDWLYFDNMGAYTMCLCTSAFDGVSKPAMYYYSSV